MEESVLKNTSFSIAIPAVRLISAAGPTASGDSSEMPHSEAARGPAIVLGMNRKGATDFVLLQFARHPDNCDAEQRFLEIIELRIGQAGLDLANFQP